MSIRVKRMGAWIVTLCMLLSLFPSPAALAAELEDEEAAAVEAVEVEEEEAAPAEDEAEEAAPAEDESEEAAPAEEEAEEAAPAEEETEEAAPAEEEAEEAAPAEEEAEEAAPAEEETEEAAPAEEETEEPAPAEEETEEPAPAEDEAELLASSKYVATLDELRAAIAAHEPDITLMGVAGDRMNLSGDPLIIDYGAELPGRKVVIDLGICNVYAQANVPVFIVDGDTNLEITADQTPENNGRLVVGNFTASAAYPGGGGVYVKNGSLVLRGFTEIVPINKVDNTQPAPVINANGGAVYVGQDGASSKAEGGPGAGLVMRQRASINGFTVTAPAAAPAGSAGNGGAVYIAQAGSFIMNGGGNDVAPNGEFAIYNCQAVNGGAVYVNGGTFEMNAQGGRNTVLYDNTATSNGGAVYLNGGSFTMKGGSGYTSIIRGNNATNGGGVYQTGGATFTIDSAEYTVADKNGVLLPADRNKSAVRIYGNTATENGGGVYVKGSTFQLAGGLIGVNRPENLDAQDGGTAVNTAVAPDNEANTAGISGGGVYLDGGTFILGDNSKGGAIIGNRAGEADNDASNGGGIYVNGDFQLYRGKIQGNSLKAADSTYGFNNAFLFGVAEKDARRIDVKNRLYDTGTKIYVTVDHFEQDPNKYSWQITKDTSYSETNPEGPRDQETGLKSIQNDASKFIWPDNKDWAIALYGNKPGDYTVHADGDGMEVAITLNQWRRLQHLIYLAVTGNLQGGNDIVGVQQNVFAQDYDKPLVVGAPEANTRQFRASDPSAPNYYYETDVQQHEITLDLHDYEVNRKLNYYDQASRTDGYAIEVQPGFTLTIKNETSTDSSLRPIGRIVGGKMEGDGGGVIIRAAAGENPGGIVNLQAGFITGNQATRNGGGVYVENGAVLNIEAVDKDTTGKISSNIAGRNGGGVYVDQGGTLNLEKGTIGLSADSNWSQDDSSQVTDTNSGNTATSNGGGVYVANGGTATLNTGAIRGNTAKSTLINANDNADLYGGGGIYVDEGGTLTMEVNAQVEEGELNIAANTAMRNGGGIYIASPNVTLTYGTIGNNNRAQNGGGIYVALPCGATADVLGTNGIIFDGVRVASNIATANGGGVYLAAFRENESLPASRYRIGKMTMNSGLIRTNQAKSGLGGGVYLAYHQSTLNLPEFAAEFVMKAGSINEGNSATSGGGVYVPGEVFKNPDGTANVRGAAFTMVSGTISGNTASTTDGAGGVYAGNNITVRGEGAGNVVITGNTNGNVVLPNNNTTYSRDVYEGTRHLATRRTIQQIYVAGDMNASQIGVTIKEGYGGTDENDCALDEIVIFTEDFYEGTDKDADRFARDTGLTSRIGGAWLFQDDKDPNPQALTVPSSNEELNVAFFKKHHEHNRKTDPILDTYRFKPIVPSFENNDILYYLDNETMVLQPGNYRLYSDLHFYTARVTVESDAEVNLCLNNRTVFLDDAFNTIEVKGVLRLFDDGPMKGDNNRTALGTGNFQHTAPITDADTLQGSFITVDIEGPADKTHANDGFYMYGGTIHDLKATESIVKVGSGALYDFYGGVIEDCEVKEAVVNVDSGTSTIFKLRGNVKTEIVDNKNTDPAHPEYGAIYVAGRPDRNDTMGDLSNFWISDFAIRVSGNTSINANNETFARNLYLGSPANGTADYATVYVYGSFRVAQKQNGEGGKKEPIGVEVDPDVLTAIAAQPANTPNHDREYMFTYHYGRIVGEDLTNKEYTYNFISESDQYMVRPDRNSYANENQIFDGELRMVQHTHVWNFYRDEGTKRLYAYCEHQDGQADCDYTWELAAGNPIDEIEMVKQLMYNKKDGEFVPANNTDNFVLRTSGANTMTIKISDYFTHSVPDGKIDYLPEINAQSFIHIANSGVDSSGKEINPTDPQNWLTETADGKVTLTAGNEYTVVFLARYDENGNGAYKNSPCVEFNFTVSKDAVQRGDIDGDGELTLADAYKIQSLADRIDFENYEPTQAELDLYDVTSPANPGSPDGRITAHDAIYIGDRAELLSVIDESLLEEDAGEAPAAEGFVAFPILTQKKTVTDPGEEATLLAAGNTVITVGGDTPPAGVPGDTVTLPVSIKDLPANGINGAVFDIGFNSNVLELTNVEPGLMSAAGGSTFRHAFNYPDFVSQGHANRVSWRNFSNAITSEGTLFTLEFRVLDGAAPGDYPISMAVAGSAANFMSAGEAVSVTFNRGTVTVQKKTTGDDDPAPAATKLIVDNVSGKPGDKVQVPIRVENNPGFRILYLTIQYDHNVLTLNGLTPNDALTAGDYKDHWNEERLAENRLRFVSYEGAVKGDITLVTAEFTIAENAPFGATSVSLEISGSPDNFYTGSATITPEFVQGNVSVVNDVQYTVTWANNDGSTISTEQFYAGSTPVYSGTTPTRVTPEDETLEPGTQYVFAGWNPAPASLFSNMTYTAQYEKKTQTFQVTWYDEDGTTVLITSEVPYGQTPSYPADGPTLTKDSDPQSVYAFAGWDPAPAPVTSGNVSYKATYTTEARTYTITYNITDELGTNTHSQTLPYGSDPAAAYNGPKGYTKDDQTMVLVRWDPDPVPVTASTAYTAQYAVSTKEDMTQEPTAEFNEDQLTLKNLPADAEQVTVTITYTDADGETKTLDPQTVSVNENGEATVRLPGPAASNQQFTVKIESGKYADKTITVKAPAALFIIRFVDYAGENIIAQAVYADGTSAADIEVPTSVPARVTDSHICAFIGWDKEIVDVTDNATYTAVYQSEEEGTIRTFTITWKNDDGSVLRTDENMEYGSTPNYGGEPSKANPTAGYTYRFTGWTPALSSVTGDAEYTATYDEGTVKTFTITWKNDDGTVLETDTDVPYGTTPSYDGATPVKTADDKTYTFQSWTPAVAPVTGNAEYTATFDEGTVKTFTITFTWKGADGNDASDSKTYAYGTKAADIEAPSVPAMLTASHVCEFVSWDPQVADVTGDASYSAVYQSEDEAALRTFTITFYWLDSDGKETSSSASYTYGTAAADIQVPTVPNRETADATYTFTGWNNAVANVTGDASYTAQYNEEQKASTYTVIWNDMDGTELKRDENVASGTELTYDGPVPSMTAEGYTYTWTGWTPEVVSVTADATYTATYDIVKNTYTVKWLDEDGTVLEEDRSVEHGSTPTFDGDYPVKTGDEGELYPFKEWTPAVGAITGDTEYTAVYEDEPLSDETFFLTVNNGIGTGSYRAGEKVNIYATVPSGKTFRNWTSPSLPAGFVLPTERNAVITMPAADLQLTANFKSSNGCYVATAVYGSYDCPEVWTLRRFRDKVLAKSWYGRLFISLYYAISPTAVRFFGQSQWFHDIFHSILDPWVANLQANGFASTPYKDLDW